MFNKTGFIYRLDFLIRVMHPTGHRIEMIYNRDVHIMALQEIWNMGLSAIWENRYTHCTEMGVTDKELFSSFSVLLTTGLNQLNTRVNSLQKEDIPVAEKKCIVHSLIVDQVKELAEEVEELLSDTNQHKNGKEAH